MATTVKVPGVGPVNRKWIYVGGAVVAVIVGWAYYVRSRSGSGEVTYDPATGSIGGGGYQNPVPNGPDSGVEVEIPEIIDTNAEWGTAAVQALLGIGWDAQFAATAIGKYLAGVAVTSTEADAVRAAWGMLGKPPVNPPNLILVTTGPAAGTPAPTPVPVPTPAPPKPAPPKPTPKPAPPRRYVLVQKYTTKSPPWQSTLSGIAGRTGRTVGQLASWNGVAAPKYVIHPNQKIYVDPPGTYNGTSKIG